MNVICAVDYSINANCHHLHHMKAIRYFEVLQWPTNICCLFPDNKLYLSRSFKTWTILNSFFHDTTRYFFSTTTSFFFCWREDNKQSSMCQFGTHPTGDVCSIYAPCSLRFAPINNPIKRPDKRQHYTAQSKIHLWRVQMNVHVVWCDDVTNLGGADRWWVRKAGRIRGQTSGVSHKIKEYDTCGEQLDLCCITMWCACVFVRPVLQCCCPRCWIEALDVATAHHWLPNYCCLQRGLRRRAWGLSGRVLT